MTYPSKNVSMFSKGDIAIYIRTKEKIKIIDKHLDSPEGAYYTILMPNGSERQTEQTKLKKIRKSKKKK
jgi:hypothetical protein